MGAIVAINRALLERPPGDTFEDLIQVPGPSLGK